MGMLQPNQERARGGGGVGSSLKAKRAQINPLNININMLKRQVLAACFWPLKAMYQMVLDPNRCCCRCFAGPTTLAQDLPVL